MDRYRLFLVATARQKVYSALAVKTFVLPVLPLSFLTKVSIQANDQ